MSIASNGKMVPPTAVKERFRIAILGRCRGVSPQRDLLIRELKLVTIILEGIGASEVGMDFIAERCCSCGMWRKHWERGAINHFGHVPGVDLPHSAFTYNMGRSSHQGGAATYICRCSHIPHL